jgi:hypothetical protein
MKAHISGWIASSLIYMGLAVSGWGQGSDNFDDNSRNTINWGSASYGTGTLTEMSQQLIYSGGSGNEFAGWLWSGSPTYATSWSAQVDVLVPGLTFTTPGQGISAGIYVEGGPVSPSGLFNVSLTLAPYHNGSPSYREYDSDLTTSGTSSDHVHPVTSSLSAALKIDFNATTHVISTYYDDDGATGGYAWTQMLNTDISAGGNNWGMGSGDRFTIMIIGASMNIALTTGDGLALDNFSTSVSAIPEPSTYAAIFGAVALAGGMIHRRRRRG